MELFENPVFILLNFRMTFTCETCRATFTTDKSLKRHIRAQHQDLKHLCQYCQKAFRYQTAKARHEKNCNSNKQQNDQVYTCEQCNKHFKEKRYLESHTQIQHMGITNLCENCGKVFKNCLDCKNHSKTCHNQKETCNCSLCDKTFSTRLGFSKHQLAHEKQLNKPTSRKRKSDISGRVEHSDCKIPRRIHQIRCRECNQTFLNRHEHYLHRMKEHFQTGSGVSLQQPSWRNGPDPFENNLALRDVYEANRPLILQNHQEGPVESVYNYPISNEFTVDDIMRYANDMYDRQQSAFRLNLEFGLILTNTDTGEYRYFTPYSNESLFERPIYISRRQDLQRLKLRLQRLNITDYILRQRPDTKWKPVLVTNVRLIVYHLNYSLGIAKVDLPDYVKNSRSIIALDKNLKGKYYKDHLCAFRCLASHQGYQRNGLETHTKVLFTKWVQYMHHKCPENNISSDPRGFKGIELSQLAYFEKCFQINVNVFRLQEDQSALPVYKSHCHFKDTMHLNLFDKHLSYISNIAAYTKKYQCPACQMHFKRLDHMKKHRPKCQGKTKHQFPGGFYSSPKTIFDKLDEHGIMIPAEERIFPWFLVFDFEAMITSTQESKSEKLTWTAEHVPISVSICSNVEGFQTPFCIVDPDTNELVAQMVRYMTSISEKSYELAKTKFAEAFKSIDRAIRSEVPFFQDPDETSVDETLSDSHEWQKQDEMCIKRCLKLNDELEAYCHQLPCISFNGSKYDLNLIKKHLAVHLKMQHSQKMFAVKRNNQYACLSNETFKFLDITQYLAPGVNYASFLKAFDVKESKGFFPYEWFTSVDKLDYTELPPFGPAWFSSLKNDSVLNDGLRPPEENYILVQEAWTNNCMKTFKEYLVYYNNLDCGPFVEAVQNLQKYYFNKNIDIFKVSISLPGLARQMLFECGREAGASFALFDESNKDLYYTVKDNIIGGPSIIFNRYHKAGETFIRGNPDKQCQTVVGYDANALYLWSIDQEMPCGPFVRRKAENEFKPEKRDRYSLMYDWMDYVAKTKHIKISHKLNTGREKRVGPFPVDGFDEEHNTIYQMHGCYWHGHNCWMTKSVKDAKWQKDRQKKYNKTIETTQYLLSHGFTVVEMWECEFRKQIHSDTMLKAFINSRLPNTPQRAINEFEILAGVQSGGLFGMVEVDISVPDQWPDHFAHPTMTPHKFFQEMSPLFCTTDVPFGVIGSHMQAHVKRFGLSQKARRLLVGGMKARQLLLATPLLKWYLDHGLEVTKIHQVIEFKPQRCFHHFVQEVSDARRQGDSDKSKAILADTCKLLGNASYGSTIMDKEKFQSVKYVQGEGEAMMEANLPQFKKLTPLLEEEEYYEIEKAKKCLKMNLPIQIGYFILQYAKLRMLQFYYDFMDKFVNRDDFEYCEMDTDSAYMALAGPSLESVIKPEMKQKYMQGLKQFHEDDPKVEADNDLHWFPRTCCGAHAVHDKRTVGLFKLEWQADTMIGLCSKTYIVSRSKHVVTSNNQISAYRLLRKAQKLKLKKKVRHSRIRTETKFSSKGISKRRVRAPMTTFKHVLSSQKPGSAVNKGFRAHKNGIFTYEQERCGFSYLYCKRRVLENGIDTEPLDLELCPVRKQQTDADVDDAYLIHLLATNFESDNEDA